MQELEKRRITLAQKRDRISHELEKLETEHTELFETAADYDEPKRKVYAQKIKLVEKKIEIKEERKKLNTEKLATVIFVSAVKELRDRCENDSRDIDAILADPAVESDDVIMSVWDSIVEYNLDHGTVAEVQNELDLDLIDIEAEPKPEDDPISKNPHRGLDETDIEIVTEADPLEEFDESDFDLYSDDS